MSTVNYPFTGREQRSVTFSPILDGNVYTCQMKWNIAAQRWYLLITDSSDNTVMITVKKTAMLNLMFSKGGIPS